MYGTVAMASCGFDTTITGPVKTTTDLVGITALTSEKLVLAVSQALNLTQGLIGTVSKVHL